MTMKRYDIIGSKKCQCGCGEDVLIRKIHLEPKKNIPRFKDGHHRRGHTHLPKGGIAKIEGYFYVYCPTHPNCRADKYVRKSRLIMEEYLDRYLEKDEIVHHINKDILDDRIDNLELMTRGAHISCHNKEKVKYQTRGFRGRFCKNS